MLKLVRSIIYMASNNITCDLVESNGRHSPIQLKHNVPQIIGRSRTTKITDRACSKNQVELTANFDSQEVTVKQLGVNPSNVAGKFLTAENMSVIGNGSYIYLAKDCYKYHVFFNQQNTYNPKTGKTKAKTGSKINKNKKDITKQKKDSSINNTDNDDSNSNKDKNNDDNNDDADCNDDTEGSSTIIPAKKKIKLEEFFSKNSAENQFKISSGKWEEVASLLIFNVPIQSDKIAGFDLDGTLITTKSGRVFPINIEDWKPLYSSVKAKLHSLCHTEGYSIVIFSNQLGVSTRKLKPSDFKRKIEAILSYYEVPICVLAATQPDIYRKPAPGMWEYFTANLAPSTGIDLKNSFYCGDAAGRPANWMPDRKKDFSASDLKFAQNIHLKFFTPEEIFMNMAPVKGSNSLGSFNPCEFKTQIESANQNLLDPPDAKLISDVQEIIIFVGLPASGKTSFYQAHFASKGYAHINRDTLKTWQKCVAMSENLLSQGKSIVIDNTNPDVGTRMRYIELGEKFKIKVRIFWFTIGLEHCQHNNIFRKIIKKSESHKEVDIQALRSYQSKYMEPKLSEGVSEIVKVNFIPNFINTTDSEYYYMFLK